MFPWCNQGLEVCKHRTWASLYLSASTESDGIGRYASSKALAKWWPWHFSSHHLSLIVKHSECTLAGGRKGDSSRVLQRSFQVAAGERRVAVGTAGAAADAPAGGALHKRHHFCAERVTAFSLCGPCTDVAAVAECRPAG